MEREQKRLDLAAIRERLAGAQGPQYWRSLEELAETEEFQEILMDEFPRQAMAFGTPIDRRQFLKVMAAGLALAGLSGCRFLPQKKIVPYVKQPEEIVPGKPLYFASAITLGGFATGVLVESHEGRPTKIEGNELHPASLGATDTFTQAALLTLYDPDRSQAVLNQGQISSWDNFLKDVLAAVDKQRAAKGGGIRILTETVTSPTLASLLRAFLQEFPAARWHQYEPVNRDNVRAGTQLAFGEYVNPVYHFDKADVILSLDADFLFAMPGSVRYARDFADRRRVSADKLRRSHLFPMNRLYVVESKPTITGAMADHRLPLRPSQIEAFARTLAQQMGLNLGVEADSEIQAQHAQWLSALVNDLKSHQANCLIVPGDQQSPVVHAIAHALNIQLGNVGRTVVYTAPVEADPVDQTNSLRELVQAMGAGQVNLLLILGGNPVYYAPADLPFAQYLTNPNLLSVHLGLYNDETAALCNWHIPEAHPLEAWGDARAYDGTVSIIQPLIEPLYGGKSAAEVVAALLGLPKSAGYDLVHDYWLNEWKIQKRSDDLEAFFKIVLHDGVIPDTAAPVKQVALKFQRAETSELRNSGTLELAFVPDPTIWDGRFANNGWLQELPKPLTKLTWDNAALMSASMAERLGLAQEIREGRIGQNYTVPLIELKYEGRSVVAPVWIVPGHPDNTITLTLGYGRTRAGKVGSGIGVSAYALCTSEAPWFGGGVEVRKTGGRYEIASTELHHPLRSGTVDTTEGRDLIRVRSIEELMSNPQSEMEEELPSLYHEEQYKYDGYAWGMVIDTSVCIGCNACVIACQAENNIPVVGKEQVKRGREMHWIRIDRYYKGSLDDPETYLMPVPCMHCENAPCEPVCPVGATVHSAEGLNQMVYNRCVGTRYCSNNCPYKVRRFNFYKYVARFDDAPVLRLLQNPDVTVRGRGVMEKCTYCVQRINEKRIEAKKQNRQLADGEVLTACQQVCPTKAIIFGNLNDANSEVARLKSEPHHYTLLKELNTRPRTTYLAKIRNPNPELSGVSGMSGVSGVSEAASRVPALPRPDGGIDANRTDT